MKIIICTDLEGVAGVVSFESQVTTDAKYYETAKKLLTAEVNAAVDGILQSGNAEIIIWDGHGGGAISFEDLHEEAKLIHGCPMAPIKIINELFRGADATIMIGQHAMAGVRNANMNHTQSSRTIDYFKLNGRLIGEIAQYALNTGALGIPLIFLSGDDAACKEAEDLVSGIVTARVKNGLSRNSALSLSAKKSRALIQQKVFEALSNHKKTPVPPLVWESPYVLQKHYFHTDIADMAASIAGVKRIDEQTVQLESDNILDIIYA